MEVLALTPTKFIGRFLTSLYGFLESRKDKTTKQGQENNQSDMCKKQSKIKLCTITEPNMNI